MPSAVQPWAPRGRQIVPRRALASDASFGDQGGRPSAGGTRYPPPPYKRVGLDRRATTKRQQNTVLAGELSLVRPPPCKNSAPRRGASHRPGPSPCRLYDVPVLPRLADRLTVRRPRSPVPVLLPGSTSANHASCRGGRRECRAAGPGRTLCDGSAQIYEGRFSASVRGSGVPSGHCSGGSVGRVSRPPALRESPRCNRAGGITRSLLITAGLVRPRRCGLTLGLQEPLSARDYCVRSTSRAPGRRISSTPASSPSNRYPTVPRTLVGDPGRPRGKRRPPRAPIPPRRPPPSRRFRKGRAKIGRIPPESDRIQALNNGVIRATDTSLPPECPGN